MALTDNVDGRADLYSLGCVAYYLLSGRQVFEADTVMQVFAQHLQTVPIPPSQKGHLAVPRDLEQLVLDCLAKKPEDRPQTAAELDRRLALMDVGTWTNVDAKAWWATVRPSTGVLEGDVETRSVHPSLDV
jgi:serine/threonine-protein kinase